MATGTVRWFAQDKGHGAIARRGGDDVYVHHTAIQGTQHTTLRAGMRVTFEVVPGTWGDEAINVTVLPSRERGSCPER